MQDSHAFPTRVDAIVTRAKFLPGQIKTQARLTRTNDNSAKTYSGKRQPELSPGGLKDHPKPGLEFVEITEFILPEF